MFKKSYNRALLTVRLTTVTPLLIRAGDAGLDPTAAELSCVRTRHARLGTTVYVPGSSYKGVIRSAAEAALRGQKLRGVELAACDPLDHGTSCGGKLSGKNGQSVMKEGGTAAVYRKHCLCCRLFGSLALKGRAAPRDLFPWPNAINLTEAEDENRQAANRVELRHGVAIDRVLGSVKHGPFDQEIVPAGVSFWGDIALENYQAWQLGLLATAFDEVNGGFAQFGSSKSRGLGVATLDVASIVHEQAGAMESPLDVAGEGLATEVERESYGLFPPGLLPPTRATTRGFITRFEIKDQAAIEGWMAAGRSALRSLT